MVKEVGTFDELGYVKKICASKIIDYYYNNYNQNFNYSEIFLCILTIVKNSIL